MEIVTVALVAFVASGLTFFSGFGLGTILLPALMLFFPVPTAVALTAVVHFLNNLFKLGLVGRHADWAIVWRFGLPGMVAAFIGARALLWLSGLPPLLRYGLAGREFAITPINLVVATIMLAFALLELWPRFKEIAVPRQYLPLGGALSGFFGGLSGHQGAFRSMFLLRSGLDKEAFIATGVVIAIVVDVSRLVVYLSAETAEAMAAHWPLLLAAVAAAFLGAFLGNSLLKKITMRAVELTVTVLLVAIAMGLALGLI